MLSVDFPAWESWMHEMYAEQWYSYQRFPHTGWLRFYAINNDFLEIINFHMKFD